MYMYGFFFLFLVKNLVSIANFNQEHRCRSLHAAARPAKQWLHHPLVLYKLIFTVIARVFQREGKVWITGSVENRIET